MAVRPTIRKPQRATFTKPKGRTTAEASKLTDKVNEARTRAEEEDTLARRMKAEVASKDHNETFDQQTFQNIPENRPDALYSIESVIYSQIAILMRRKNMPDGLKPQEWARLNDLVRMMKGLNEMELTTAKKSLLEGLSNAEVLELVDEAKKTLLED